MNFQFKMANEAARDPSVVSIELSGIGRFEWSFKKGVTFLKKNEEKINLFSLDVEKNANKIINTNKDIEFVTKKNIEAYSRHYERSSKPIIYPKRGRKKTEEDL